jgi:predicted protein tyrosine phosphatase
MRKLLQTLVTIIACIVSSFAIGQFKRPLLVMDMSNSDHLPRNFRSVGDDLRADINKQGLADLRIAGGAQFSKMAFQRILTKLRQKHIMIIDLRQEPHGFMNSNAVSWYGPQNAMNAHKTDAEIEEEQTKLLEELSHQDIADVFNIVKKSKGYISKAKAKQYAIHQVMNEGQFAEGAKQQYNRLYVQDYHAPDDQQIDRFMTIVKELPQGKWIYFHCRAGIGRTTTFMTMYDMIRNAKNVSFEDILARQHAIGGKDLTLPATVAHKKTSAVERLAFLKKFYEYAKTNEDEFATNWIDWKNKK